MTDDNAKGSDKRESVRVQCKSDESPTIVIDGQKHKIIDMSETSIRFELQGETLKSTGKVELENGHTLDFIGKVLRVTEKDFVIHFDEKIIKALAEKIRNDIELGNAKVDEAKGNRCHNRVKYIPSKKIKLHIDNVAYDIIDISEVAAKIRPSANKHPLKIEGNILFPDKTDTTTEGTIIRLEGKEGVFVLTNKNISSWRISKEVFNDLDEFW